MVSFRLGNADTREAKRQLQAVTGIAWGEDGDHLVSQPLSELKYERLLKTFEPHTPLNPEDKGLYVKVPKADALAVAESLAASVHAR